MPLPIVVAFAAAGAIAGTGLGTAAGGVYMWRRTKQEEATRSREADLDAISRLLSAEMDLADLKRQAEEVGVDVQAVEAGYKAYKDSHDEILKIASQILNGEVIVPTSSNATALGLQEMAGDDTSVVSDRAMREWLRKNGYSVPSSGPLAKQWKRIYWESHEG